jgi:hypothetical protein
MAEVPVYSSTGDQGLQAGGDSLDDGTVMEEGDTSPQPQNRRTRREACTCPFCKDGEARYLTSESVNTIALSGKRQELGQMFVFITWKPFSWFYDDVARNQVGYVGL